MKTTATVAALLLFAVPTLAQTDDQGWHVVRPGDTLEEITAHYIGFGREWPKNHALNPDIDDPDLLFPGQRLLVTLRSGIPAGFAQLTDVSHAVEEQPAPISWQQARERDLLQEKDGIRTAKDSSAVLLFGDGTNLTISEDSLLFLHGAGAAEQPVGHRNSVEIVVGQADLSGAGLEPASSPVEIVLGDAVARPAPAADGSISTRARTLEQGSAQVMVYVGTGTLAAGGTEVALEPGTGSTVLTGGPPTPPEKLLDAPVLIAPATGIRLGTSSPTFSWQPIDTAVGYTIEICEDTGCGRLVQRTQGLADTRWTAPVLAPGRYTWRVTAVSDSGLDGFPARTAAFEVVDDPSLLLPPKATITGHGTVIGYGESIALAEGSRLKVTIEDPTGSPTFHPTLDGEAVTLAELESGWSVGIHEVGGTIIGGAGTEVILRPTPIVYDPNAPQLAWEVGGLELLYQKGLDQGHEPKPPRKWRNRAALYVSPDGRTWSPLVEPNTTTATHIVACDDPQLFIWAAKEVQLPDGQTIPKNRVGRMWASDDLTAVRDLVLDVDVSTAPYRMKATARDILGNESVAEWASGSR